MNNKGTFLENIGPGKGYPGMHLDTTVVDRGSEVYQPMPATGLAKNLQKAYSNPEHNFAGDSWIDRENFRKLEDHSYLASELSEGIKAKAHAYGVKHLVGLHKHQSSFTGGAGLKINLLEPGDIIAYHNFLGSLNQQEQYEYSQFLGINFDKVGKAIGSAAKSVGKAVGKVAVGVAHVGRDIGVGVAKTARNIGVGVAHGARGVGLGVAHVGRDIGVGAAHLTRKYWPELLGVGASIWAIASLNPELVPAIWSVVSSMKSLGASNTQIDQALQDQGLPPVFGASGGGSGGYNPDDYSQDDMEAASQAMPDDAGNMQLGDGTSYNINTGLKSDANGNTTALDLAALMEKPKPKTDYVLWAGIAAILALVSYYLIKNKKLNFKF